jgi:acyl transferase domain-containing protein
MSDFLTRISQSSPKRVALLADELNERVKQLEHARHEPIAIVGIGCRMPGGADTPDKFWALVRDGVDAITEVPADRWDVDAFYDPDPDVPGKMATRWGGFLSRVDGFDPVFFGISPREAQSMDPQQRLLLEVTWEALENAAISSARIDGTRTGIFVGMSAGDYFQVLRSAGPRVFDAYTASGVAHSVASGRLSYVLGARGPSLAIDTACSSSLVAIHEAVHSLRRGESDIALAGGVNLILSPDITIALSRAHMMAPDGRCKAFDARADGFVRSEGCGMLVLKRLSDAEADGDRIVALIRGAAANQDGRSNGLTAPNGPSQEAVLREALADARLDASSVDFIEAHGTGTSLGDPIEVQALAQVLGRARAQGDPLLVGSVKANVGHLEAAAGVAGVIKLALALERGQIPGQPHFERPNPFIPWDEIPVRVPRELTRWPVREQDRRVGGVSSFGFSGTNVHLVLEAAQLREQAPSNVERPLHLLTASARQEGALREVVQRQRDRLLEGGDGLADIAFSANVGRSHFAHRIAVVAPSAAEAAQRLDARRQGSVADGVFEGTAGVRAPRLAFMFTGQGSQYAGMAAELYATQPVFRSTIDRCDALLRDLLPQPLLATLFQPQGVSIDATEFTQPALFAVEYALANLWMDWGVRPAAAMGHSVGEVVAACVAGVFSLEDGLRLVTERGRLMGALPQNGAMVAVMAEESRVRAEIAPFERELSIAAINGPRHIVISGLASAVEHLTGRLSAGGVDCIPLKVSHAFHSPLMDPMLEGFERFASTLQYKAPGFDLISNVTGQPIGTQPADARYWREHARATVRFASAVQALTERGCTACLEIGPHPTLVGMARQCPHTDAMLWLPSLRRGRGDWAQMLESLAQLYTAGVEIDWAAFDAPYRRRKLVLPTYPFQRERYWVDQEPASTSPSTPKPLHPLLGWEVLQAASDDRVFETRLGPTEQPWLEDHRILNRVLIPSPVYMEMALAAAAQLFGEGPFQIDDLVLHQALPLRADTATTAQLVLSPQAPGGHAEFRVSALDGEERRWHTCASGRVQRCSDHDEPRSDLHAIRTRTTQLVPVDAYYDWLASLGLEFGSRFRGVDEILRCDGEVLARLRMPEALRTHAGVILPPALLDACFHVVGAALPDREALDEAFLLLQVERIRVRRPLGPSAWAHVTVHADERTSLTTRETFRVEVRLLDDDGALIAGFEGVRFKRVNRAVLAPEPLPARVREMLHEVVWRPQPASQVALPVPGYLAEQGRRWLIVPDSGGHAEMLAAKLREAGDIVESLPNDIRLLGPALRKALGKGQRWDGVLDLQAMGIRLDNSTTTSLLWTDQERLVRGTLEILHTLAADAGGTLPGLWLITRGAQAAGPAQTANPAQATLWGMSHVIAFEHPELCCRRVDLDPASDPPDTAAALIRELDCTSREDQVALRQGRRFVRRLARHAPNGERRELVGTAIDADRSYLVTGGLRGLGLRVAQWLADQGARHLVLMGRQPPLPAAEPLIAALRGRGVQVLAAAGDVALEGDLHRVLSQVRDDLPSLAGVIHAAGALDDGVLTAQSWERFATVLAAKTRGSWNLHTMAGKLDFLVLFSSGASVAGSAGQANYAAANAFEDALAWYRQALGLPTVSINWGPWADIGTAADRKISIPGYLRWMAADDGLRALEFALQRDRTTGLLRRAQLAVLASDWSHPAALTDALNPLLSELTSGSSAQTATERPPRHERPLRERLTMAAPNKRRTLVRDHVRQLAATVLGLERADDLDVEQPLRQLGLDSLMAVELRNRLNKSIGQALPATITFDYPSVAALVEYLAAGPLTTELAVPTQAAVPQPETTSAFESFSEDELAVQLLSRLDSIRIEESS